MLSQVLTGIVWPLLLLLGGTRLLSSRQTGREKVRSLRRQRRKSIPYQRATTTTIIGSRTKRGQ